MIKSNSTYPHLSIWSDEQDNIVEHQHTPDTNNTHHRFDSTSNDHSTIRKQQKCRLPKKIMRCWSSTPICLRGLLLGVLVGGLVLSVITPLWLTSTKGTASAFVETSTVSSTTVNMSSATINSSTGSYSTTTQGVSTTASISSASTTVISTLSTATTSSVSTSVTTLTGTTTVSSSSSSSITSTSSVTTSSSTITLTTTSCNTPTSTIDSYLNGPSVYQLQTYNYIAPFSGVGVIEFGFYSSLSSRYWHLDDVSMLDLNASNSEMLINGDFENGTLAGWQVLCTANCASWPGTISNSLYHTGSYCYEDGCRKSYDFLRQTFTMILGHTYTLSFWIYTDSSSQQKAFVRIN